MTSFASLGLRPSLLEVVQARGYADPTPIQAQAIPLVLAGHDVFACAQTGTGKTAAFSLPLLHEMAAADDGRSGGRRKAPRVLVLTPTRELAAQVAESFSIYGAGLPLRCSVVYGGVSAGPQIDRLRRGLDVLVACPGRLLDLMSQGHVDCSQIEHLVLDEADRMLDMGFIKDIHRIIAALPRQRQTLLFSATIPAAIEELAAGLLHHPRRVAVATVSAAADTVDQRVYHVPQVRKIALLKHVLKAGRGVETALIFTRTKHGADRVVRQLRKGGLEALAIHGNKSQGARQQALDRFKQRQVHLLVATDIASRGLDIKAVDHVINFEIPHEPETYVHRIGRTGRAGLSGVSLSFCAPHERDDMRRIENLLRHPVAVVADHPYLVDESEPSPEAAPARAPRARAARPQSRPVVVARPAGHNRRRRPSRRTP